MEPTWGQMGSKWHQNRANIERKINKTLSENNYVFWVKNFNKTKILDRTKKLNTRKIGDIGFAVTRGGEVAGASEIIIHFTFIQY